jgi:arylsulfatase A-like enzyme
MDVHTPRDPGHVARVPRLPGWSMGATPGSFPRVYWTTDLSDEQGRRLCNLRRLYDAQIAYVDEALAPLIEDVRSRGGLVAVTSDHGEGLFTRRRDPDGHPSSGHLAPAEASHGYQRTEEALRVPIWLAGPGVPVGRRETRPVAMRDLGETLAALAGLPGSGHRLPLSGHDASPAVILGTDRRGWFVRTADRKLLMPFPARMADPAIRPTLVAVTAASYAAELKDLAADEPEQLGALLQALEDWRTAHPDEDAEELDALTLQRLEALGYLR